MPRILTTWRAGRTRLQASPIWSVAVNEVRRLPLLVVGILIASLAYAIFQVPYSIAAGGLTGVAILVNRFTGWPVGVQYFIYNLPMLVLGFFYLGRWPFVLRTLLGVALFSFASELILRYAPMYLDEWPITDNVLLSAVYAGLVGGIGGGLLYRAGATMGGTGILGRVVQLKTGIPLSTVFLYTDGGIVLAAGAIFGWELALYAMLTLLVWGAAADYVLEGPSRARTATIITNRPQAVTQQIFEQLDRGVTYWEVKGGYRDEPRTMILCAVYRPQVRDLRRAVADADPEAFVVIGVSQQALGSGFLRLNS